MIEQTLSALESLSLEDTLRKASLQLVSRLPTESEIATVTADGEAGLKAVLDASG